MNKYGERAMSHWSRWCPTSYSGLEDPERYFTMLGESIADRIGELAPQIAGPDLPGETFLQKAGRWNTAQLQAEEMVFTDLLPEPEVTEDDLEPQEGSAVFHQVMSGLVTDYDELNQQRDREWDETAR